MKKLSLLVVAAFAILVSCTKSTEATVSGHLDGLSSDSIFVNVMDSNFFDITHVDTIITNNGDFSYTINPNGACQLSINNKPSEGCPWLGFMVILMPGDNVTANISPSKQEITGSTFYDEFNAFNEMQAKIQAKTKDLEEESKRLQTLSAEEQNAGWDELSKKYDAIQEELAEAIKNYIAANSTKDIATYVLPYLAGKEYMDARELLTEEAKKGVFKDYFVFWDKEREREWAIQTAYERVVAGTPAPDFTVKGTDGQDIKLTDFRGKYLVVDFWGSWCSWCIKGIPEMKKYYAKYSDKVEFLSIACNDLDETWRKALTEQQMPWVQAINGEEENNVPINYGVSGYPTKVVIDPDGIIEYKTSGENPDFYEHLDQLFK